MQEGERDLVGQAKLLEALLVELHLAHHVVEVPRPPHAVLYARELAARHGPLPRGGVLLLVPQRAADVALLLGHALVQRVALARRVLGRHVTDARDDVHVHVGHRLPGLGAVLYRDVEGAVLGRGGDGVPRAGDVVLGGERGALGDVGGGEVVVSEEALHLLDGAHQVVHLGAGEVRHALVAGEGAHEDVAGEEGLEVDDREGVRRLEEDLRRGEVSIRLCLGVCGWLRG